MNDKSNVGMELKVCKVCGKEYATGTVLLHRRLKPVLERMQVTGWGVCPDHAKLFEEGYVALVGVDPEKSAAVGGKMAMEDAHRTGSIAHVRRHVFAEVLGPVFGLALDEATPMVYVDEGVLNWLHKMSLEGRTH